MSINRISDDYGAALSDYMDDDPDEWPIGALTPEDQRYWQRNTGHTPRPLSGRMSAQDIVALSMVLKPRKDRLRSLVRATVTGLVTCATVAGVWGMIVLMIVLFSGLGA